MKRWLVLCVCALVALAAIGCGSDSDSGNGATTASDPDEPITLTVWYWGVPPAKAMKEVDDAYMAEHPNVTIKRVVQPATAYFGSLLRSTIAKRSGPDILMSFASPYVFDFEAGVYPLNDLVTDEQKESILGFDQATMPDGTIAAVPFDAGGVQFYYDKAKFETAGLDPEAPPTTWDELLTACDKLKAAGITPINGAFKDGGNGSLYLMAFLAQYQTDEALEKMISDPDWTDPAISKTWDLIRELYDRECFTKDSQSINLFPEGANNFLAGKAAMHLGFLAGDMHWAQYRETDWGKDGLGTFLPPLLPDSLWDEQKIQYSASSANFITKWSPNPEAAYDYLMYISGADAGERLFKSAGTMPASLEARPQTDDPTGAQILEWIGTRDQFLSQFNVARANVEVLFQKNVAQLITGKVTYDEIGEQLQAEQDKAEK